MKEKIIKILNWLNNPPIWFLVLTYFLTLCFIIGSMLMLIFDFQNSPFEIVVYIIFVFAAITLSYTVYTFVKFTPKIKKSVVQLLHSNKYTDALLKNYGLRTIIFAIGSFIVSIAYSGSNLYLSITEISVWFGVLAGYYMSLAFMRGGILLYHKRKRDAKGQLENDELRQLKSYRTCGIVLIFINLGLSIAVIQMVFIQRTFSYSGLFIYVAATYAFYKISMSIYNLFKAKKQDDYTIKAIRNINLIDALVSILALQTALLTTFQTEDVSSPIFNGITGSAVCLFTLGLGIAMIVIAQKRIIEIKNK